MTAYAIQPLSWLVETRIVAAFCSPVAEWRVPYMSVTFDSLIEFARRMPCS
jgi:hypothetical protein